MSGTPLVIVVGRGHSGTRAIARTLVDSGVFMGGTLNESYDLVPADQMYEACRLFARDVVHQGGLSWDFSALLAKEPEPEFERLVRSYLSTVLESDAQLCGWKLPETTLVLPWIVRMFPDAFYIYWVRDPRDSIIGGHLTDDIADFGVRYDRVEDLREMRAISWKYQREIVAATVRPRRWMQVRFEDLVLDQEKTVERLESYLGVPLARIEMNPEAVGRWKNDPEYREFPMFQADLAELGYTQAVSTPAAGKGRS